MPLVKIEIYKNKSQDYKKALFDGIHRALITSFKIKEDDRTQRIYEFDEENFERRAGRTTDFTLIEITAFKGRSKDAKRQLYQEIVKNLGENPGIKPDDILIVLNEPELGNWGVSGGKPADEVNLGFKINV